MFFVIDIFWKLELLKHLVSAIFHLIKLPFDAKAAERILKSCLINKYTFIRYLRVRNYLVQIVLHVNSSYNRITIG